MANPNPVRNDDGGSKQVAIIGMALGLGVVMFSLVAVGLPLLSDFGTTPLDPAGTGAAPAEEEAASDLPMLTLLSIVHLVVAVGAWSVSLLISSRMVETARRDQDADRLRAAYILKWALCEGAAMFGIVIVLIGGLDGTLPAQSHYYANLVTTGAFLGLLGKDLGTLLATGSRG